MKLLRCICLLTGFSMFAHENSGSTIFSLPFENSLTASPGGSPSVANGVTYVSGIVGTAGYFATGNTLSYASSGNINNSVGSIEFFVKPSWNGNDFLDHTFMVWGGGGGMLMKKDAVNNMNIIFRRYNVGGNEASPITTPVPLTLWKAGDTHYLVLTWDDSAKSLALYIDGSLRTSSTYTGSLPTISSSTFQIGGEGTSASLYGAMDEFKIHDIAVSSAYVAQRYATTVPEPSSLAFVAAGTAGMIVYLRHRRRGACCI